MITKLLNLAKTFTKRYWKYIIVFFLGVLVACALPATSAGRLMRKTLEYVSKKNADIDVLQNKISKLNGEIEYITKEKNASDISIKNLSAKNDSLLKIISGEDSTINKINNYQNEEDNTISNFSDKQLNNFFTKYKTR